MYPEKEARRFMAIEKWIDEHPEIILGNGVKIKIDLNTPYELVEMLTSILQQQ